MQESFWWWQCSDWYIISLFPHLRPSPINLMVSVHVKHHERTKRLSELRSCVKVEVAILGPLPLAVLMTSVDVKQH